MIAAIRAKPIENASPASLTVDGKISPMNAKLLIAWAIVKILEYFY